MGNKSKYSAKFKEIYDSVFPLLVKIVFKITGNVDMAEEICQEAFIRLYERIDKFPDANQAKYWLIRVGKNLAINQQKRKGRERKAYERVLHEPKRKEETGEIKLLKQESYSEVQRALDTLPDKLKTVLVLKEYGNLNYKEIADILKISEGNVKVRVYRARKQLLEYFKDGGVYVP
jgi:RNA polymerase sigma-70 factor (ECF subfamily)